MASSGPQLGRDRAGPDPTALPLGVAGSPSWLFSDQVCFQWPFGVGVAELGPGLGLEVSSSEQGQW